MLNHSNNTEHNVVVCNHELYNIAIKTVLKYAKSVKISKNRVVAVTEKRCPYQKKRDRYREKNSERQHILVFILDHLKIVNKSKDIYKKAKRNKSNQRIIDALPLGQAALQRVGESGLALVLELIVAQGLVRVRVGALELVVALAQEQAPALVLVRVAVLH